MIIPRKRENTNALHWGYLTHELSTLKKDDKIVLDRKYATRVYRSARSLNIKITTRTLGDSDSITVYRID